MKGPALAAGSLVLAALVTGTSSPAASRPVLTVTSAPNVQTLHVNVVTTRDARTHRSVSKLVLGTATFHVVVRNPGDVALTDVTVRDPLSRACVRSVGTLAPGASVAYVCSAENVGRNFTNRIVVSGTPAGAGTPVRALAGATFVNVKPKKRSSHVPAPVFQQGVSRAPVLPFTG